MKLVESEEIRCSDSYKLTEMSMECSDLVGGLHCRRCGLFVVHEVVMRTKRLREGTSCLQGACGGTLELGFLLAFTDETGYHLLQRPPDLYP